MLVTVKFYVNIALFMGKKELKLTLDDSKEYTIGDVIDEITRIEGRDLKGKLIGEGGKHQWGIRIILNSLDIDLQKKMKTKVKDGDTVSMFPLVGGG